MIISTLGEGCEDKWADRCKVADGKCSLKSGVGCWDCYHHHHHQRLRWRVSRFHTCHEFKIEWPNRRELEISFGFLDRVGDRVSSAGQQDCWSENAIKIKGWDQDSSPSQLQEQTTPNLLTSWSLPSCHELVSVCPDRQLRRIDPACSSLDSSSASPSAYHINIQRVEEWMNARVGHPLT